MELPTYKIALIVGAGEGLSASLARLLAKQGVRIALAARAIEKLGALCRETGARVFACDATDADDVERLFGLVEREIGSPDLVVYNASGRARGAFAELVPAEVSQAIGAIIVTNPCRTRTLSRHKHGGFSAGIFCCGQSPDRQVWPDNRRREGGSGHRRSHTGSRPEMPAR